MSDRHPSEQSETQWPAGGLGGPGGARLPVIALVGRTNVGKSTLFNRLTGGHRALVAPTPGLTRDRREGLVRRAPYRFQVVDTGGMEFDAASDFGDEIAAQVEQALGGADGVWLVVDAKDGLTPIDERLFRWLDRRDAPVWLVVNKVDHAGREADAAEFYKLGADVVFPLSAQHGRGLDGLLAASAEALPVLLAGTDAEAPGTGRQPAIRVALLGKPNVGKSSLVNRILGEGRMIVSEIAGTTREPVDVPLQVGGERFVLIDTAGLRRKARTKAALEKIGALTSLGALERADVAILVVDAGEPISEQDAKIAGHILNAHRAVVVALNKWDLVKPADERDVAADIQHRLRFVEFAPVVRVSAQDGRGIDKLFQTVRAAHGEFTRQIQTADLNRIVNPTVLNRPPPSSGRSPTKVHYGTQVAVRPPTFWFFTNHPDQIDASYSRYFANQLRYHFGLIGTPIVIRWKGRDDAAPRQRPPPAGGGTSGKRPQRASSGPASGKASSRRSAGGKPAGGKADGGKATGSKATGGKPGASTSTRATAKRRGAAAAQPPANRSAKPTHRQAGGGKNPSTRPKPGAAAGSAAARRTSERTARAVRKPATPAQGGRKGTKRGSGRPR